MFLLAAPVLANADPSPVGNAEAGRSANVYAKADDVDCSKLDDDDARQKCREKKVDRKTDDANVDCSKLDDDDAREKCRDKKVDRKTDDVDVESRKIDDNDARRRCLEAKVKN
jgi:hypothetical protein